MVNTDDFIKRLENILEYNSLSASSFADKIGVQRSSLSHLLSGRNKPSLDFILKIIDVFPEVDLYWILNGKGIFPKSENENESQTASPIPTISSQNIENIIAKQPLSFSEKTVELKNNSKENIENNFPNTENSFLQNSNSEIDRIVIFYKNGSFKTYSQE